MKGREPVLQELNAPEEPQARRYIATDTTYEALGDLLADNPNGILVFRDELISLLKTLDDERYIAARGFFLFGWSGTQRYQFDRIIRGHTHIERTCISLLGSTQPARISEYVRRAVSGEGDDGLIQRFGLMVWPDHNGEWRNVDRYPDTIAKAAAWRTFEDLDAMTPESARARHDEFESIPFLRFDNEAQEIFDAWREQLEKRLRSGQLHPALESHLAKYRKLAPALALVSSLADAPIGCIDAPPLRRAIAFADYLESHARRIYGSGKAAEAKSAEAIIEKIRKGDLKDGFTCRDIHQRDWSNLSVPARVQAALDLLVDLDWLAEQSVKTAGRPKTTYLINPKAHSWPL
jgi:hypothetical protein